MQVLAYIMSRAVSDVSISSISITTSIRSGKYYILVAPDHAEYWIRFKEKYPNSIYLAHIRSARVDEVACPEFDTVQDLLNWLSDALSLSQGEKNLLRVVVMGRIPIHCCY